MLAMIGAITQEQVDIWDRENPWMKDGLDICDVLSFNPGARDSRTFGSRGYFKAIYLKAPEDIARILLAFLDVPKYWSEDTNVHGIFVLDTFVIGPTARSIVRTRLGRIDLDG